MFGFIYLNELQIGPRIYNWIGLCCAFLDLQRPNSQSTTHKKGNQNMPFTYSFSIRINIGISEKLWGVTCVVFHDTKLTKANNVAFFSG